MVYRKYDGALHWHQPALYLGEDRHGRWVGAPSGTPIRRGAEPPIVWEYQHVALFPPGGWWTAVFNGPPAQIEVYCDITSVPRWCGGSDGPYVTAIDLDLDVARRRDGTVTLLDEDEFAEHRERYGYPPDIVAAAEDAARWLTVVCADGTEPFGTDYRGWLDQVPSAVGRAGDIESHWAWVLQDDNGRHRMSENWVDGSYESGADDEAATPPPSAPPVPQLDASGAQAAENETGATLGQGEGSTFEPEEDAGEGVGA